MSFESEDAEAAFGDHLGECDACAMALVREEELPGIGCIDEPGDYPDWDGTLRTTVKGL